MSRLKAGAKICWKCQVNVTSRRIDGVPICDECLLRDSRNGTVRNYSKMKSPKHKRSKAGKYEK